MGGEQEKQIGETSIKGKVKLKIGRGDEAHLVIHNFFFNVSFYLNFEKFPKRINKNRSRSDQYYP
jgi:hypothetical protein